MGDEVAGWLTAHLGKPVRLLAATAETKRLSPVSIAPDSFVDLAPLLVTSQESLADLNTHLEVPVSQRRFRPNIVVEGLDQAWDEDTWHHIRIGEVELEITFGCARCALPDVDDETAEKVRAMPVNKALKATRLEGDRQTYFGQNARVLKPGTISVGDSVEILSRRDRQLMQAEGKEAYKA